MIGPIKLTNGNFLITVPVQSHGGIADVIQEITPQDPRYGKLAQYVAQMNDLFKPKSKSVESNN